MPKRPWRKSSGNWNESIQPQLGIEEGLEETLIVHRLGIGGVLRRKPASTNPIESCLSTVQRVTRNVKRLREGDQPTARTATGLLEAEKEVPAHQRAIKKSCC